MLLQNKEPGNNLVLLEILNIETLMKPGKSVTPIRSQAGEEEQTPR